MTRSSAAVAAIVAGTAIGAPWILIPPRVQATHVLRRPQPNIVAYYDSDAEAPDCYPPDATDANADATIPDTGDAGIWPDAAADANLDAAADANLDAAADATADANPDAANPDANLDATVGNDLAMNFTVPTDAGAIASFATAADTAELRCTNNKMTVCAWIKFQTATARFVFGKYGNAQSTFRAETISCSAPNCKIRWSVQSALNEASTVNRCDTPTTLSENQWHYLCGVMDLAGATNADRLKVYWDNTQQTCTFFGTIPSAFVFGTAAFNFGKVQSAATYFGVTTPGTMDEPVMFCDALTPTQLTFLYSGGHVGPNDPNQLPGLTNWKIWLRFGDGDVYPTFSNRATGCSGACPNFTLTQGSSSDIVQDGP